MGSRREFDNDDGYSGRSRDRHRSTRSPRDRFGSDDDRSPSGPARFDPPAVTAAPAASDVERVTGTVAWFKAEKGFGFLTIPGKDDTFLPLGALEDAGHDTVKPGATIVCDIRKDKKGFAVAKIHSVDQSTAANNSEPRRSNGDRRQPARVEETVRCVVKWFDDTKGFGFLASDRGYDVFVHVSTVRKAGMETILQDETFLVEVAQGDRGKVAVSLEATA